MEVSRIIAEIDAQISKLQQARALLSETSAPVAPVVRVGRGRPKGSKNQTAKAVVAKATAVKAAAKGPVTRILMKGEDHSDLMRIAQSDPKVSEAVNRFLQALR